MKEYTHQRQDAIQVVDQKAKKASADKLAENSKQEASEVTATFGESITVERKRPEEAPTPRKLAMVISYDGTSSKESSSQKKPANPYTYDELTIHEQLDMLQIQSEATSPSPVKPPDSAVKVATAPDQEQKATIEVTPIASTTQEGTMIVHSSEEV